MNQTSRKYDLEERTARFDEPAVKLHHFFIENLLSRFVPPCPALSRFAGSGEAMTGSGEARKIGNWKLKIGIIALLFFIWCDYASAFTITTPTKNKVGLVGHWTFDGQDMLTGTVRDVSGNNNHGSMVNMATATARVAGKAGQALNFDNTNDSISLGDSPMLPTSYPITVTAWVKANTLAQCDSVLQYGDPSVGRNWHVELCDGHVEWGANNLSAQSTEAIMTGRWYFIAVSNSAVNSRVFYVIDSMGNGFSAGESNTTSLSITSPAGYGARIGAFKYAGSLTDYFDGTIDDVRTYNRALSASEIQALYKMGEGTKTATTPKGVAAVSGCTSGLSCGLVGHWTFDGQDMLTGTVRDVSGNNNHGSMVNMATATARVAGKVGQALQFDGTNDLINAGSGTNLDNLSSLTISLWANARSGGEGAQGYFIQKAGSVGSSGWRFNILSNYVRFNVDYNSNDLVVNAVANTFPSTDYNKWVHWVVTWNGSPSASNVHVYKNGVEVSYGTNTDGSTSRVDDSLQNLIIGNDSVDSRTFDGLIDDVRIYNRALSPSEIQALYKMGEGTKTATTPSAGRGQAPSGCTSGLSCGLVGHWTFDGPDMLTGTVRDVSGNNNHGSMVNMATATARVAGKVGQGLRFDGVNDYININSVASLIDKSKGTYAAWVYVKNYSASTGGSSPDGPISAGYSGSSANGISFLLYGSTRRFSYYKDSVETKAEITNAPLNTWHHIVATWDESNVKIYYNGILSDSNPQGAIITQSFDRVFIGSDALGTPNQVYFNGTMDDVRIYNRALSVQEIQQLYNMGR